MSKQHYTRSVLLQMLAVAVLLSIVIIWQWKTLYGIYIANQINAVGWIINGTIGLLFLCGMVALIRRFFEYQNQEIAITRFLVNAQNNNDPTTGLNDNDMVVRRYTLLKNLNNRRAQINQSALAATLLASEASRNSFLKFVHNILILTGVFGTVISLSVSLLGASDLIQGSGTQTNSLGTMIFGMSTALSTTMTAIICYIVFGYFYIKLTDTQTYLISRVEEVTSTTLLPHLQLDKDILIKDYADSIRSSGELIKRFDQTQQHYAEAAKQLQQAATQLFDKIDEAAAKAEQPNALMLEKLDQVLQVQKESAQANHNTLTQIVKLLNEGFRLRP